MSHFLFLFLLKFFCLPPILQSDFRKERVEQTKAGSLDIISGDKTFFINSCHVKQSEGLDEGAAGLDLFEFHRIYQ